MRFLMIATLTSFHISLAAFGAETESKSQYIKYAFDEAPLKKHPTEYAEFITLRDEGHEKPASEKSLARQLEIIETISKAEPDWIDGYWMVGELAFQQADSISDPNDNKKARALFLKGQEATKACLKKDPKNPLCKMFLGASLGKVASIDGILSSASQASNIEKLLLEVVNSNVERELSPYTSLQGIANYALGIFYRLVPDGFWFKAAYKTQGDIQKSIAFHEVAAKINYKNPCNHFMLGVAKLCAAKGDVKSELGISALQSLASARKEPAKTAIAKTCIDDISKIEKDPSLACGYEASKQQ